MGKGFAVIDRRRNVNHFRVSGNQRNERHEEHAIQTIHVEVLRRLITRRKYHTSNLVKGFENVREDQCIGNVGDLGMESEQHTNMELIKTNQHILKGDLLRHLDDGILFTRHMNMILASVFADLLLFVLMQLTMELLHELVEMHTTLASIHGHRFVKQIHEVALSRSHVSVQVDTSRNTRNGTHHAASIGKGRHGCHLQQFLIGQVVRIQSLYAWFRLFLLWSNHRLFPCVVELTKGTVPAHLGGKTRELVDG